MIPYYLGIMVSFFYVKINYISAINRINIMKFAKNYMIELSPCLSIKSIESAGKMFVFLKNTIKQKEYIYLMLFLSIFFEN